MFSFGSFLNQWSEFEFGIFSSASQINIEHFRWNRIDSPHNPVHIKIADYGISRISLPTGTKGFGGTEGFMAPEIICHNGEEEYTEKVKCNAMENHSLFVS